MGAKKAAHRHLNVIPGFVPGTGSDTVPRPVPGIIPGMTGEEIHLLARRYKSSCVPPANQPSTSFDRETTGFWPDDPNPSMIRAMTNC
jgi:hypothetical protein